MSYRNENNKGTVNKDCYLLNRGNNPFEKELKEVY
jgi:hypothetical protein